MMTHADMRRALDVASAAMTAAHHLGEAAVHRAVKAGWLTRDIARLLGTTQLDLRE